MRPCYVALVPTDSQIFSLIEQAPLSELEAELEERKREFGDRVMAFNREREVLDAMYEALERQKKIVVFIREMKTEHPDDPERRMPVEDEVIHRPQLEFSASNPETKPEIAVRAIEQAGEGILPRQARIIAVQNGWLDADPASGNQLSVAMNKMAKAEPPRLIKDNDGRYYLPEWVEDQS